MDKSSPLTPPHGHETMTSPKRVTHVGSNGSRYGFGKYIIIEWGGIRAYEGYFVSNLLEGLGVYTDWDGKRHIVTYQGGNVISIPRFLM